MFEELLATPYFPFELLLGFYSPAAAKLEIGNRLSSLVYFQMYYGCKIFNVPCCCLVSFFSSINF